MTDNDAPKVDIPITPELLAHTPPPEPTDDAIVAPTPEPKTLPEIPTPVQETEYTSSTKPEPPAPVEPPVPSAPIELPTTAVPSTVPSPTQISDTPPPPVIIQPTPDLAPNPEAPQLSPAIPPPSAIDIVAGLSDAQLKAAAALYAKRNQQSLSAQGVKSRQKTSTDNQLRIARFIQSHSPTNVIAISRAMNLSPTRTKHYLRLLTNNGTIRATGWAQSRRYYKK